MISHWSSRAWHHPLSCHGIGLAGRWVGVAWRPVALGGDAFSPLIGRWRRRCRALIGRGARAGGGGRAGAARGRSGSGAAGAGRDLLGQVRPGLVRPGLLGTLRPRSPPASPAPSVAPQARRGPAPSPRRPVSAASPGPVREGRHRPAAAAQRQRRPCQAAPEVPRCRRRAEAGSQSDRGAGARLPLGPALPAPALPAPALPRGLSPSPGRGCGRGSPPSPAHPHWGRVGPAWWLGDSCAVEIRSSGTELILFRMRWGLPWRPRMAVFGAGASPPCWVGAGSLLVWDCEWLKFGVEMEMQVCLIFRTPLS